MNTAGPLGSSCLSQAALRNKATAIKKQCWGSRLPQQNTADHDSSLEKNVIYNEYKYTE